MTQHIDVATIGISSVVAPILYLLGKLIAKKYLKSSCGVFSFEMDNRNQREDETDEHENNENENENTINVKRDNQHIGV